jgi:hypothetical protein
VLDASGGHHFAKQLVLDASSVFAVGIIQDLIDQCRRHPMAALMEKSMSAPLDGNIDGEIHVH